MPRCARVVRRSLPSAAHQLEDLALPVAHQPLDARDRGPADGLRQLRVAAQERVAAGEPAPRRAPSRRRRLGAGRR